jgi:hypothetical protein
MIDRGQTFVIKKAEEGLRVKTVEMMRNIFYRSKGSFITMEVNFLTNCSLLHT